MAYAKDVHASARRHLEAAEKLAEFGGGAPLGSRRDVAGYLYGIAAECAVKAMMLDANIRPGAERRDDPYYAHFPELRSMLRDTLAGRVGLPLYRLIADDSFMNAWDTNMRYSHGRDITDGMIISWHTAARNAVGSIGT